jgi:hypothetical protein
MPTDGYERCVNSSGQRPTPRRTKCAKCAVRFASGERDEFWGQLNERSPALRFRRRRTLCRIFASGEYCTLLCHRNRKETRLAQTETGSRVTRAWPQSKHLRACTPRTPRPTATHANAGRIQDHRPRDCAFAFLAAAAFRRLASNALARPAKPPSS